MRLRPYSGKAEASLWISVVAAAATVGFLFGFRLDFPAALIIVCGFVGFVGSLVGTIVSAGALIQRKSRGAAAAFGFTLAVAALAYWALVVYALTNLPPEHIDI